MRTLTAILALALGLRLLLAWGAPIGPDLINYERTAAIVREGGNVYAETPYYNYSPFWFHALNAIDSLRGQVPFMVAVRLFLSLFDLLNLLAVYLILKMLWPEDSLYGTFVYAINPVTLLVGSAQGQFETLALLPALLAVYMGLCYRRDTAKA